MEVHLEKLADSPGGWDNARVTVGSAIAFAAIYAYFAVVHGQQTPFIAVMAVGTGVAGAAEFLPEGWRWVATALRVLGIGILLGLIVLTFVSPDLVVPN